MPALHQEKTACLNPLIIPDAEIAYSPSQIDISSTFRLFEAIALHAIRETSLGESFETNV